MHEVYSITIITAAATPFIMTVRQDDGEPFTHRQALASLIGTPLLLSHDWLPETESVVQELNRRRTAMIFKTRDGDIAIVSPL